VTAFEKWEGTGNDFVVVEGAPVAPAVARALCDRRRGVGADGVLSIGVVDGVPSMVVVNADGSRPEMCGNGLRCVAGWLASHQRIAANAWVTLATDAGPRPVLVSTDPADGSGELSVSIRMGKATFQGDLAFPFRDRVLSFRRASMGNPHAVCFEAWQAEFDALGDSVATSVEGGVNAELVRAKPGEHGGKRFEVLVWERGVGPTLACGTGACAVAAVACREGRAPFDEPIVVELPGGPLEIVVARDSYEVTMRGPARRVFAGTLEPVPELRP
jgi:diaminopimelate epimerase